MAKVLKQFHKCNVYCAVKPRTTAFQRATFYSWKHAQGKWYHGNYDYVPKFPLTDLNGKRYACNLL